MIRDILTNATTIDIIVLTICLWGIIFLVVEGIIFLRRKEG